MSTAFNHKEEEVNGLFSSCTEVPPLKSSKEFLRFQALEADTIRGTPYPISSPNDNKNQIKCTLMASRYTHGFTANLIMYCLKSYSKEPYSGMTFGPWKKSRNILSSTKADLHVHIMCALIDISGCLIKKNSDF